MAVETEKCLVKSAESLNAFSPLLVNFEYGSHSKDSDLDCDLYIDPENHTKRTLIVQKGDQRFLGKQDVIEQLSHTLILVRNKKTNEGRVYMTQSCSLINLEREEENLKLKRKRIEEEKNNEDVDWKSQYHQLRQSFGSKKSKRASGVAQKLNLDMSLNKGEIKDTVADIDVKLSDINTSNYGEDEILKLLPACNRYAKKVEDVYCIDNILTVEEREYLKPAAEFLISNGLKEIDEKTNFFIHSHYSRLGSNPDIDKVALLIYGDSLVKFFNMKIHEIRGNNYQKICPHSRVVAVKILNEFTVMLNSVRTRPSYCKDKVVCYLIVIIVLACNFQVDIEVLSSSLKGFGQKKLIQLARLVGLTFTKGPTKLYTLKIPLARLPQIRQPRPRKR